MELRLKRAKKVLAILMIVTAVLLVVFYVGKVFSETVFKAHSQTFTIVIDAGHGGIDGGVVGVNSKVKESDLNLDIAKKLKAEFEGVGIKVVMTRSSYGGLYGTTARGFKLRDMKRRIEIINSANADLMISVHLNFYSSPSRRGATTFFRQGNSQSERLANCVQKHFNKMSGQTREYKSLKGDYYLLNNSNCPSVICECGFLSSPEDEKLLLTEDYRKEIAKNVFRGGIDFLLG